MHYRLPWVLAALLVFSLVVTASDVPLVTTNQKATFPIIRTWETPIPSVSSDDGKHAEQFVTTKWGVAVTLDLTKSTLTAVDAKTGDFMWRETKKFFKSDIVGVTTTTTHIAVVCESSFVVLHPSGIEYWRSDVTYPFSSFLSAPLLVLPEVVYFASMYDQSTTSTLVKANIAEKSLETVAFNRTDVFSPTLGQVTGSQIFSLSYATDNIVHLFDPIAVDKLAVQVCGDTTLRQQTGGAAPIAYDSTTLVAVLSGNFESPSVNKITIAANRSCALNEFDFNSFNDEAVMWLAAETATESSSVNGVELEKGVTYMAAATPSWLFIYELPSMKNKFQSNFPHADWFSNGPIPRPTAMTDLTIVYTFWDSIALFDLRVMNFTKRHLFAEDETAGEESVPTATLVVGALTESPILSPLIFLHFPTSAFFCVFSVAAWYTYARYNLGGAYLGHTFGASELSGFVAASHENDQFSILKLDLNALYISWAVVPEDDLAFPNPPVLDPQQETRFFISYNKSVVAFSPPVAKSFSSLDISPVGSTAIWREKTSISTSTLIPVGEHLVAPTEVTIDVFDKKHGRPVKSVIPSIETGIYSKPDDHYLYFNTGVKWGYRLNCNTLDLEKTEQFCAPFGLLVKEKYCDHVGGTPIVDYDYVYYLTEHGESGADDHKFYLRGVSKTDFGGGELWNTSEPIDQDAKQISDVYSSVVPYLNHAYIINKAKIHCIDGSTGKLVWEYHSPAGFVSLTPFYNSVYGLDNDNFLFSFGLGGEVEASQPVRWIQQLPSKPGAFAISPDGIAVLVSATTGNVFAVDTQKTIPQNKAVSASRLLWSVDASCSGISAIQGGVVYLECLTFADSQGSIMYLVDLYRGVPWLSAGQDFSPTALWALNVDQNLVYYESSKSQVAEVQLVPKLYDKLPPPLQKLTPPRHKGDSHVAAIIGGTFAGAVVVAALSVLAFRLYKLPRRQALPPTEQQYQTI